MNQYKSTLAIMDLFRYAGLSERDSIILGERIGLSGKPCSLNELGDRFGITGDRTRQIEARQLRRIKWFISKNPDALDGLLESMDATEYFVNGKPLDRIEDEHLRKSCDNLKKEAKALRLEKSKLLREIRKITLDRDQLVAEINSLEAKDSYFDDRKLIESLVMKAVEEQRRCRIVKMILIHDRTPWLPGKELDYCGFTIVRSEAIKLGKGIIVSRPMTAEENAANNKRIGL